MIVRYTRSLRWHSFVPAALVAAGVAVLCGGCSVLDGPVLNPDGPIGLAERNLMFKATAIMMIVIIPVFIMAAIFTVRYRGTNKKATYTPKFDFYWPLEIAVWGVPAAIVIWLATHLWADTYKLDPYTRLDPSVQPLVVEAISLDWKWLFVYPEQNIATVNELVVPVNTPVSIKITSDTVMNSLIISGLGGQIYAMAGMQTRLNLLADNTGEFWGRNLQYSGSGFADQQFRTLVETQDDFDAWVAKVRASGEALNDATYKAVAKPQDKAPVSYYSTVEDGLFDKLIAKFSHGDMDRMPSDMDGMTKPAEPEKTE